MSKTLLIVGHVWPEPNSSAAGTRMMQLIHIFLEDGYNITFASACSKTESSVDLTTLNIRCKFLQLNDGSFDAFVIELEPSIVLFDRFMVEEQYGWRVAESCPDALRILDTEDLHFLRKGRELAVKQNSEFTDSYLYNDYCKREIASIYRCDLSLIISEYEMALLKYTFKIDESLLCYLPMIFPIVDDDEVQSLPKFNERVDFLSIGNFKHPPNYDAVLHLKHEIWPLIRKQLPNTNLHVYGAYPSKRVTELHNKKDGFLVHGRADDVVEVMRVARLSLAPLRFGAGLKGKVFDAIRCGTPSVMSSIAAEGIFMEAKKHDFITDLPIVFANAAVEFYNNKIKWKAIQKKGFDLLNSEFSMGTHEGRLRSHYNNLIESLKDHRNDNFIGQILQHHTLKSTKYMSKWIEEKNRKAD